MLKWAGLGTLLLLSGKGLWWEGHVIRLPALHFCAGSSMSEEGKKGMDVDF